MKASLELIVERGAASLSLREVARRAGVTHGAPYHHFADRSALLATIADEGFRLLAEELEKGPQGSRANAIDRLVEAGNGYVRFALSHPAHFQVMFRPELWKPPGETEISSEGQRAFQLLVQLVLDAQEAKLLPSGPPHVAILTLWATVHGISSLLLDGPIPNDYRAQAAAPGSAGAGAQVVQALGAMMAAWGRAELSEAAGSEGLHGGRT